MDVLGKPEVVDALRDAGREGEAMAKKIERAGPEASKGLRALDAAARKASDGVDNLAGSAGPAGTILSKLGRKGVIAAAGLAAVGVALTVAFSKGKAAAAEIAAIGDASDRIGIAAEVFEKFSVAVKNSGQETSGLEAAFVRFQTVMAEAAKGGKQQIELFKQLKVDIIALRAEGAGTEEILLKIADGFAKIEDPAERARLAQQLFSEGGLALASVLSSGSEKMKALFGEADKLGQLYGGDLIRNSQNVTAELARQSEIIDKQLNKAMAGLAKPAADLAKIFASIAVFVGQAWEGWKRLLGLSTNPLFLRADIVNVNKEIVTTKKKFEDTLRHVSRGNNTKMVNLILSEYSKSITKLEEKKRLIQKKLVDSSGTDFGKINRDVKVKVDVSGLGGSAKGKGTEREAEGRMEQMLKEWAEREREEAKHTQRLRDEQEKQIQAFRDLRVRGVEEGTTALLELAFGLRSGTDVLRKILTDLGRDLPALLFGGKVESGFGGILQGIIGGAGKGLVSSSGIDKFIGGLLGGSSSASAFNLPSWLGGDLSGSFGNFDFIPTFGFASGGSFEVSPATSLGRVRPQGGDDQLVAFRAQVGERVTVSPRGRSGPGGSTFNWNVVVEGDATEDTVDRFRRVAREEIARARPQLMQDAVLATDYELKNNSDFG